MHHAMYRAYLRIKMNMETLQRVCAKNPLLTPRLLLSYHLREPSAFLPLNSMKRSFGQTHSEPLSDSPADWSCRLGRL